MFACYVDVFLCENDKVITLEDSRAKIVSKKGDVFVMDANSVITLNQIDLVNADDGRTLFTIAKRPQTESFVVKTKFSTIGVKGTQFLVSQDDNVNQLSLKQGLVEIKSSADGFELFSQQQLSEFDAYQKKQLGDFEQMKDEMSAAFEKLNGLEEGYLSQGMVEKVEVEPGQTLTIAGEKALLEMEQSIFNLNKIESLEEFAR